MILNNKTTPDTSYLLLTRYISKEHHSICEDIRNRTEKHIDKIKSDTKKTKEKMLTSGLADLESLKSGIQSSVIGKAKWKAEVLIAKGIGEAISRIFTECKNKLKKFAYTKEFIPIFENLVIEAVQCARELHEMENEDKSFGEIFVGPHDVDVCKEIILKHGFNLTVKPDKSLWGGLEISITDTTYIIRNTILSRMEKNENKLMEEVVGRLKSAHLEKERKRD